MSGRSRVGVRDRSSVDFPSREPWTMTEQTHFVTYRRRHVVQSEIP